MVKAKFKGEVGMWRAVEDMAVREIGYTVPWAFDPKTEELDDKAPIFSEPGGTVELIVERVSETEYVVSLPPTSTYEYSK